MGRHILPFCTLAFLEEGEFAQFVSEGDDRSLKVGVGHPVDTSFPKRVLSMFQEFEYRSSTKTARDAVEGPEMALAHWMTALGEIQEKEEFVSVQGARMRCLVTGDGPPLLLLHGLLGTADAWGAATQRLAAHSTVYAPDALGIGGSDRVPKVDVSLAATAGRLTALMDAKGIGRADIVGTSHGGSVALMLAALHPERVRSLV